MKIEFQVYSSMQLEAPDSKQGMTECKAIHTDIALMVSKNLELSLYLDKKGYPNAAGSRVITEVLCQALMVNLHSAHVCKYRDSAEHYRYILKVLEEGFLNAEGKITHT